MLDRSRFMISPPMRLHPFIHRVCLKSKAAFLLISSLMALLMVWGASKFPSLEVSRSPSKISSRFSNRVFTFKENLWHLDLKGAPPRIEVLEEWLRLSVEAGATGVLVEWENIFPYDGILKEIPDKNAYSKVEVRRLWKAARQVGLKVIPLVQSLGHLEFLLKKDKWKYVREVQEKPMDACPSNPHTLLLIMEAMNQVLSIFPSSYIHIGGDEVYNLGLCSNCKNRNVSSIKLYLTYMESLATYLKDKWNVRILMWDDMLRSTDPSLLEGLGTLVEPVVWAYSRSVVDLVSIRLINRYSKIFSRVWVASAFKGASGTNNVLPNVAKSVANSCSWVALSKRIKEIYNHEVHGIVITGWSRYNHFSFLCELLPPAIPSLVYSLAVTSSAYFEEESVQDTVKNVLNCPQELILNLKRDPYLQVTKKCNFTGYETVSFMATYTFLQTLVNKMVTENSKDPQTISKPQNYKKVFKFKNIFRDMSTDFRITLKSYFKNGTVEEWSNQHMKPLRTKIDNLHKQFLSIINTTYT